MSERNVDAREAYRLRAIGQLQTLQRARGLTPAARALLYAGIGSLQGVSPHTILARLRAISTQAPDYAYVADAIVTSLANLGEYDEAALVLTGHVENREVEPLLEAWRVVLAAHSGRSRLARDRRDALTSVVLEDPLLAANMNNRLALASYYLDDHEVAFERGLAAARDYEGVGAFRLAAIAYSLPYNVAHAVRGDTELAQFYAARIVTLAERAGDESTLRVGLVAQLEIAAEIADPVRFGRLRGRLRSDTGSTHYQERFAEAMAESLANAIFGTMDAFCRSVERLASVSSGTPAERAMVGALRALGAAAQWRDDDARDDASDAENALVSRSVGPAYDYRTRRLAKILTAAARLIVGPKSSGLRALATRALATAPEASLARYASNGDSTGLESSVLGYARLIDAVRATRRIVSQTKLTPMEERVLRGFQATGSPESTAHDLDRSVASVRYHLANIRSKFGVSRSADAVRVAEREGLLPGRNGAPLPAKNAMHDKAPHKT